MSAYTYRVTLVLPYTVVMTTVELEGDEHFQNLSHEAKTQALIEADYAIEDDLGARSLSDRADDVRVELLLDDEEIDLDLQENWVSHV